MKRNCIILICATLNIISQAAYAQKKLSVNEMHEDIEYYFDAIKTMHPYPYAKYSEAQIDSIKLQLYKNCSHEMDLFDFNFLLAKTSKYMDGHTGVYSPLYDLSTNEKNNMFPIVRFVDNKIALNNFIIKSINGIPSSTIIQELENLISWEYHPSFREKTMNSFLTPLLYRVFHISHPFVCNIEYSETNRSICDTIIKHENKKEQSRQSKLSKNYDGALLYEYHQNDSIALLFYNTSDIWGNKILEKAMDNFTKIFFEQLKEKNIKYLFIDVSQNVGGSDKAHKYFFRSLKTKPYMYTQYELVTLTGGQKRNEQYCLMEAGCKTIEDLPINKVKELKKLNLRIEKKVKKLQEKGNLKSTRKFKGNKKGFDGKVFIIMGNNTYSAGHDFCEEVKWNKMGLLVGEESGQRFPYSGNACTDTLPNSGIKYYFATSYFWTEPALPTQNGFLKPDLQYNISKPLTIEDYKAIIKLSYKLNY